MASKVSATPLQPTPEMLTRSQMEALTGHSASRHLASAAQWLTVQAQTQPRCREPNRACRSLAPGLRLLRERRHQPPKFLRLFGVGLHLLLRKPRLNVEVIFHVTGPGKVGG